MTLGRIFVRGFFASYLMSASMLKPIAAARAHANAATHSSIFFIPAGYPQYEARHRADKAKGSANRVCSSFTSLEYAVAFLMKAAACAAHGVFDKFIHLISHLFSARATIFRKTAKC